MEYKSAVSTADIAPNPPRSSAAPQRDQPALIANADASQG